MTSLADDYSGFREEARRRFPQHFHFLDRAIAINDAFSKNISLRPVSKGSNLEALEVATMGTFMSLSRTFQAGFLLVEHGYPNQARQMARSLFELRTDIILLLNGSWEEQIARGKRYSDYAHSEKYHSARRFYDLLPGDFISGSEKLKTIPADIIEIALRAKENWASFKKEYGKIDDVSHWSGLKMKDRLKTIGLESQYGIFTFLSQSVHSGSNTWNESMKKQAGGTYIDGYYIFTGPVFKNVGEASFDLVSFFLDGMIHVVDWYGLFVLRKELRSAVFDFKKWIASTYMPKS
jgi:hypothetical protein